MQHFDPPKKASKGRDTKDFWDNATASLRIMQKTSPDDTSQLYLVASALASAVATTTKEVVNSIFYKKEPVAPPAPKPKIDVEEDSKKLIAEFSKIESRILELQAERSAVTKQIKDIKEKKKAAANADAAAAINLDPKLKARQLELLAEIDTLLIDKVTSISENIREHARRRVDLFFLLSIAVYNKRVVISKGATIYQHGVGSKKTGTAACHASLIPNPEITPLDPEPGVVPTSIVKAAYWVSGFFTSPTPAAPAEPPFTLSGTYLDDLLNMTTELPTVVNDFDGQMEGKYEQSIDVYMAISILNKVARGELNPVSGLTEFLKYLKEFFTEMDRRYFRKEVTYSNNRMILYPRATKFVWQYEMEGTFQAFNEKKQTADSDYIHMMLKLSALSKAETANYYLNPFNNTIEARILEMQKEILSSKSNAKSDKPVKREKNLGLNK